MCQRRTARSAGELDVLLLMLCIQCKKMYTVWVRFTKEMEAGMFKTAEAAFVRLRACSCAQTTTMSRASLGVASSRFAGGPFQPPVCGRPHLRQDE
jgi:hypothetical protein